MKTMTVRNLPDSVYAALAESAQENHRSLQEQVRHILMHDVQLRQRSVCEEAAAYRTKLSDRAVAQDVVQSLREDRER
jgi:plasmid stability protein